MILNTIRKYLFLLFCILFSYITLAQQTTEDQRRLQAYADEIQFNIQLMQGKVSFKDLIQQDRLFDSQIEDYRKGNTRRLGIRKGKTDTDVNRIIIANEIYFYKELSPKFFIPYDSKIEIWSDEKHFSVKDIAGAIKLTKCFKNGSHTEEFRDVTTTDLYLYSCQISSSDIDTQNVAILIKTVLPEGAGKIKNLDPALAKNIRSISIFPVGYSKEKIPALRTGQTATRQGLWKADLSKVQIEQANQASEVFLQVGEPVPSLGLSEKEEKKIKWTWIDDGVEFLKAQKKGAS